MSLCTKFAFVLLPHIYPEYNVAKIGGFCAGRMRYRKEEQEGQFNGSKRKPATLAAKIAAGK